MFMARSSACCCAALFLGGGPGIETAGGFYWLTTSGALRRFSVDRRRRRAAVVLRGLCHYFLLFTAIVCAVRRRRPIPMTLLAPIVMVSCELVVPQLFPCGQWISQAWNPLVIQISELTGPLGVTALLMLVNGALYDLLLDALGARHWGVIAATVLAAALIFGAVRMHRVDEAVARAPSLKVGLVQPNFAYSNDGVFSRELALRQTQCVAGAVAAPGEGRRAIDWCGAGAAIPWRCRAISVPTFRLRVLPWSAAASTNRS